MRINAPAAYIILYALMYAAFGVASPFWPEYFRAKALSSQEIGLLLGAAMVVRLAAGPLVGRLADISESLRSVLAGCAALAAAMAAALSFADSFVMLLCVALAQAAALAPMTSIADALSVSAARPQLAGKPFEYGWIRGAASAAFASGTIIIGQFIRPDHLDPVVWLNAMLLLAAAAATALLPPVRTPAEPRTSRSADRMGMHLLLRIPRFRSVLAVSALVYGSHAMHDAFAVIRWSDSGIAAPVISLLWSEAVAAEVVVFFLIGPALVHHLGARGAASVAALAGIVRWTVGGTTTSILLLSLVQPLHGLTFALLHLACMRILGAVVPTKLSATAQTVYAFGSGLVTAVITAMSGVLYARYAGASFVAMAGLCAAALPFAWLGFGAGSPPPGGSVARAGSF
ncbi:MFS transporter [Bradyrhizobium sp.]|uniref:MFS transporter n=2 Tax=Bradyrhizobium sp. TaxID=376 RepID=UPI0025BC8548|nr:MFS transporter [Bradyrhizobium sp.]MBV8921097.1 MFS transporter [Bradyrhizobium sp.]